METPPPPPSENPHDMQNMEGEKKYYYSDGRQQYGPHTIAELMARGIRPDTLVWHKDLDDWYPARRLPELHDLLKQRMGGNPNMGAGHVGDAAGPPPKNWMVEAILTTLLCCLPFGIVAIVYASSVESKWYAGRYDEAQTAAKNARGWVMASFFSALGIIVIYLLFVVIAISTGGFR